MLRVLELLCWLKRPLLDDLLRTIFKLRDVSTCSDCAVTALHYCGKYM